MSQCAESNCDQKYREHRNWPALPALLAFACYKRKRQEDNDADGGTNQENGRLGCWGQERQQSIQPQKEEVRARSCLDDRRIWLAARTEGTKMNRANGNRNQNEAGEQDVLPDSVRHERHTLLVRQLVILVHVGGAPNDASRHGPFIDS